MMRTEVLSQLKSFDKIKIISIDNIPQIWYAQYLPIALRIYLCLPKIPSTTP